MSLRVQRSNELIEGGPRWSVGSLPQEQSTCILVRFWHATMGLYMSNPRILMIVDEEQCEIVVQLIKSSIVHSESLISQSWRQYALERMKALNVKAAGIDQIGSILK